VISLLLALVLDCKPVELLPFKAEGFTRRKVKVEVTKKSVTATAGAAVLWTSDQPPFAVMIAEDDSWIALKGPYPVGSIRIAAAQPGSTLATVDPLEHLTAEERKRVPETSCGTSWFKGWKNTPRRLELTIDQGESPPLTLRVQPDGMVSR
jgi:hypothetical protein